MTYSQSGSVVSESIDSSTTNSFTYDGAGWLVQAVLGSKTISYGFGATSGCVGPGLLANPGANSDRTSMTVTSGGGPAATYRYCYGQADQLASSTDPLVGSVEYDGHPLTGTGGVVGHGNTTAIAGETLTYDGADRHIASVKGSTTVTYKRDVLGRIIERADGSGVVRFGYSGSGDSPDLTLDASNNVVETTVGLPGGVIRTTRASGTVWSYANIHGDVAATCDGNGVKQGSTVTYDPYGSVLIGAIPDNSAGSFDDGWLGGRQRMSEHEAGFAPIIEMGARPYLPTIGRFLTIDPVQGGSANEYDYVNQDPINNFDLGGTWSCGLCHRVVKVIVTTAKRGASEAMRTV